ncbi:MAG: YggS family pyridoxal phosphate-dependent enzyme [Actinobacteria bacterium]|nr:YggS family pyridoxal phosphate-dependent enzyme [Actinomycetota bacterium]
MTGSGEQPDDETRRQELGAALDAVRDRIQRACRGAGRDAGALTLVTVTKFFPVTDVAHLLRLGVREIAENKDQEASAKAAELAELLTPEARGELTWHFVGQLQTNKARSVARYADVVQSVDRPKLVRALDRAAGAAIEAGERTTYLGVTVQVDLEEGEHAGRGGVLPDEAAGLADLVAESAHLDLLGVMAVAPADLDPEGTRAAFDRVVEIGQRIATTHPGATWRSMGMSGDLEQAIAAGATHLRVGSAILGTRPTPR